MQMVRSNGSPDRPTIRILGKGTQVLRRQSGFDQSCKPRLRMINLSICWTPCRISSRTRSDGSELAKLESICGEAGPGKTNVDAWAPKTNGDINFQKPLFCII
jgi:hypothetical protein